MPRNAWVLLLALGLLASCSSTPTPIVTPTAGSPVLSGDSAGVSTVELARRNGLTERYEPARNRLILEGPGSRVVLFPGTTVAMVNGARVNPMRRIQRLEQESCQLNSADARRIESMLRDSPKAPPVHIPSKPTPPKRPLEPKPIGPVLDSTVAAAVRVPLKRKWRYIVLHHSGTKSGNAASFGRHHKLNRGWDGLGYHFVIGNGRGSGDGQIEIGYRWTRQLTGAHAGRPPDGSNRMNEFGIGICLVGNFNETHPTENQMAMLRSLVAYLRGYCGISAEHVLLHRDVKGTDCPGKLFPVLVFPGGGSGPEKP